QYWTRARTTTFVEVGPLVVISRPWIERVLPFPESYGMGWALDLAWTDLRAEGCRMGIVDAVTIRHLAPVGLDYDVCAERLRLERELQRRGLAQIADAHQTVQRWYPWRPLPPWIRELDHVDAG
ncbi:MAG TPA: hypothetical protein VFA38_09120, partial [Nitrospirales bacterium]|nr:hypothetical protein [Nitrospirales bacterium]